MGAVGVSESQQQQAVCRGGEERHAHTRRVYVGVVEIGSSKLPCLPLSAACVGLIACLAVLYVRFVRAAAVPIAMQQQGASLRLGWLARWAVGCARVRRRFEARGLASQANERAVRAWACVRSGCVCGCGWCVNRELSVTREIWTAGQERRKKGEERQGCWLSSALLL